MSGFISPPRGDVDYTTLFPLSDHYILSGELGLIVEQVQTNYHGIRCDRAVDYEGSSLW